MVFRRMYRMAVFSAAALCVASPASAELTRVNDSGFVSRHEVVVEGSPTDVWLALISPSGWWRKEHTWSGDAKNLALTPQAGGCFCETIPEIDEPGRFTLQGSVEHMRVIQAYPEQALRMQGALGPLQSEPVIGVLTITISTIEQGTRIVWEYNVGGPMRYEVPVISKAVDGVMGAQLAALGDLLGTVDVTPVSEMEDPDLDIVEPEPDAPAPAPVAKSVVPVTEKPVSKPGAEPALKPASVEDAFADLSKDPRS